MDCAELYRGLVHADMNCSWLTGVILEDIQVLILQFASVSLSLVPRSLNKAVDWITRRALEDYLPLLGSLPIN